MNDKLEASKVKSYGNTTFLFNQMLEKLKILCVDDKWLFRSYSSSLGKLLFNNGYFDMKQMNSILDLIKILYSLEKYHMIIRHL